MKKKHQTLTIILISSWHFQEHFFRMRASIKNRNFKPWVKRCWKNIRWSSAAGDFLNLCTHFQETTSFPCKKSTIFATLPGEFLCVRTSKKSLRKSNFFAINVLCSWYFQEDFSWTNIEKIIAQVNRKLRSSAAGDF